MAYIFKASTEAVTLNQGFNMTRGNWFACHDNTFSETTGTFRGLIDAQHAHAISKGRQTASQFGHGYYDLDLMIKPISNLDERNPFYAEVHVQWMEPTPARYAALKALKDLERIEDSSLDAALEDNAKPELNPLLSVAFATDADTIQRDPGLDTALPTKGSNIIRFGFDGSVPFVYRNSTIKLDMNANGTYGTDEIRKYRLLDDDETLGGFTSFGIMPRYEASFNPILDGGSRSIDYEWAYPISDNRCLGTSTIRDQVMWAFGPQGPSGNGDEDGFYIKQLNLRGIRALGGLIKVSVVEKASQGVASVENFTVMANLTCHEWTQMS